MEKENMDDIARKKLTVRVLLSFISLSVWLALTAACIYAAINGEKMMFGVSGGYMITFFILPYLLLGGLYGYYIAMISFVMAFVCKLLFGMVDAYNMAIYLAASISYAFFAQYEFFSTKKKTLISAISTLAITSIVEMACLSLLENNEYSIGSAMRFFLYFSRDIGILALTAILMYLFFTRMPDVVKAIFPIGVVYTKAFRENNEFKRSIRKTKLSMKITAIIIAVELVLGVSVGVFMIVLFPDIKDMFAGGIQEEQQYEVSSDYGDENEENNIDTDNKDYVENVDNAVDSEYTENTETADSDTTVDSSNVADRIRMLEYRFDESALSFDLKMILLMLCVGVPLASFTNYYTKRTIGEPIGQMSDFMYDFSSADDENKLEEGRKIEQIRVSTHDEIEVLHNSMVTTVHSIEDYIERIKARQELEKELEVAQKASEAKSSFLSNMSHEIRTPINAVLGLNEMILRESDQEQILDYASSVKSAGNSLLGIVNDILDFSKIEAGKMDILPVEYHLGSTINDLINLVATKAQDKGLELKLNIDRTLPSELFGDEIRIKQCVTNILTNAVKYTEKGSVSLNISYRKADDENIFLRFRVVDTGIGIKEEDLSKLYSPFERIEEIRNRSIEGTGLGMSIVKKLLALMDTKLEVKSVYGEGSDFSFEVKQKVVSFEELGDFKEKYKEYVKKQGKYHESFRAPDAEILVVDDTPINLTVVKGLLKSTEIKVDTAESGKETLKKVTEKKYDIIFIDHRMPEMDGIETLEAMKSLEGNLNLNVPCISLTANAGAGAREEYVSAGFDDYLSKPVNAVLLEKMIRNYLSKDKLIAPSEEEKDEASPLDEKLGMVEGVDLKEAEKNCGSKELLETVMQEFHGAIDTKADNIEKFFNEKDYHNYTIAVHALKSSARIIGAMELSSDAAFLEECGNNQDEAKILELTPKLLSLYRSYKEKLAPIIPAEKKEDLPPIDPEELEGAFSNIKELLEAFDYDSADGIMKMLEEYSIPKEYQDKYNKVKKLMSELDRDALIELL